MWLLPVDLLKSWYNLFTKQDYPSPGFLKKILIDEQVSPIFAINQNKSEVFKQFEVNFVIVSSPLFLGSFSTARYIPFFCQYQYDFQSCTPSGYEE